MQGFALKTEDETIKEILGNGRIYEIPKFQRDYSWEEEHWQHLWEDIENIIERREKYHYMGYLVIQPESESNPKAKIVDGQQRLTTFSLLILSLIKRLNELGDQQDRIDEIFRNYIGSKDLKYLRVQNKLTLNRNNNHHYRWAVEGKSIPPRGVKGTVRLMSKAIDFFDKKFSKYDSGSQLGEIVETISKNLLFTSIYIGDEVNAYKVFETLNARGVQLSSGDLLKNYILSIIDSDNQTPEEVLDEFDEQWTTIGHNIGKNNYSQFFLNEFNSRNKLVRKQDLFRHLKSSITSPMGAKQYLDDLERKSLVYAALLSTDVEFWKDNPDNPQIKQGIRFLELFNIRQPISLLLCVHEAFPTDFAKVLNWIKVFSIRYNIIGRKHTGEQEALYNDINVGITNGKITRVEQIREQILKLYPSDEEFKQAFMDKSMPTEQSNKKARYLLARLEEQLSGSSINEEILTVEHVLNHKPNDQWKDSFGDNWNMFNTRIGNFGLVTKEENEKLGHKQFEFKKPILQESLHQINKNIADYDEWNSNAVESRQSQLAEVAVQLWAL